MSQGFQIQEQQRTGGQATPYLSGLLFGVILGIIAIALNLIYTFAFSAMVLTAGIIVLLVAGMVTYIWPAIRASRRTGKVSSGMIAGVVSACVSFLIGYAFNVFLTAMAVDRMRQNALSAFNVMQSMFPTSGMHAVMTNAQIQQNALSSISAIIVIAIIGLFFGAIGGLIGRSRARRGV